ncbi:Nicotinamide nucleotide repair protein [Tritonibacter multivorans]|uniref:Bifunctional NAD(P)H-hydrate repair enzyme n=1 Tax=Tritonibacter multivorans TaxID=928856 RepID=A0A0P1GI36_9RHOB|nr:bifunctional ADP-dependent NAD(P)H-hydrate dehydratase/NAD(P)H-hydrate epimerase [Tritonibacter multivorans]MDA7420462.1 bifunctional ADP-dependent NAD(P)H-hydrate dehydratase/NAD(P)H-hydrate epimerase [Tritonibacter multivorans]CUH81555.1 Nicotinamide nucleotide repair protein [Tritonibacter multivorans]SFC38060.1 yjeF C-terminal region, hydroxyethylthiazole kinase-related/yjeF N-terminal region [Tritonibacter multivorans]
MTELLTAAQMRAIEKAAIEAGEVTGLELMERAGRAVVEAIYEEWPEFRGDSEEDGGAAPRPAAAPRDISEKMKRAVVLCGPGNNGGDGFVVARLLGEQGWAVRVFLYGDPDRLPPDARVNYERWCEVGKVQALDAYDRRDGWGCDLLVDALFGTGLKRALPELGELFWNMEDMVSCFPVEIGHDIGRPAIVAVDIPSGVCSDSGRVLPHEERDYWASAASAHLTVTFHGRKLGHVLGDGANHRGKLVIKSIGLPRTDEIGSVSRQALLDQFGGKQVERLVCRYAGVSAYDLLKEGHAHKFSHGHALVLTGGAGKTGAGRLAARGALRIGAGLVTLGSPPSAQMEVACQITALMLTRVDGAGGLEAVLEDSRINALCLGPGLGQDRARDLLPVALRDPKRAVVLDADALSAFADRPADLFTMLHKNCVLTPHGGEFARLFPDLAEKLAAPAETGPAYSKVDATREAAARAGCVVLYKGADTVIASPNGMCSVHAAVRGRSAPWLATAGAGDVLAGFITGLMARGFSPHHAAETAAFLHVECARTFGPGLIAEDLPEQLPAVLRDLGC